MGMEILVSQVQGRVAVTVLRPNDRINMGNTEQLDQVADEAIHHGATYLVIDLSDVPSITSAGLRSILNIGKKLGSDTSGEKKRSPFLKLANPSSSVLQVFKIAGLDALFEIHTDMQQAIASF
jgi:anti-anti-sigma factor